MTGGGGDPRTCQSPLLLIYDGKESHKPLDTDAMFVPQEAFAGVQMCCNSQPLKPGDTGTAVNAFFSCVYLLLPVSHLLSALTLLISTAIPLYLVPFSHSSLTHMPCVLIQYRTPWAIYFPVCPFFPSQTWFSVFCLLHSPVFQAFGFGI